MKAEVEIVNSELVEMEFNYTYHKAEPDVGYMDDYFAFEVEYYVPFDDEGIAQTTVDANDLVITNDIYSQLCDAALYDLENIPERVTRACDIKESLMAPLFETLGQDYKTLTIRR